MLSPRGKAWVIAGGVAAATLFVALVVAGWYVSRRFEPYIREQAIQYLQQRFDSDVKLAALHVRVPKFAPLRMIRGNEPVLVTVEGEGVELRHQGRTDLPPMFVLRKFSTTVDLRRLFDEAKTISLVTLEGMEINLPPKGQRPSLGSGASTESAPGEEPAKPPSVIVESVLIHDAKLTMLPRDPAKKPLQFDLHEIRLTSAGNNVPMNYEAVLTNAKPPGEIHSTGIFGPWSAGDPDQTPLNGTYVFEHADLGVFNGIAGMLTSTGSFEGRLGSIAARGEASVPDFRLKRGGNAVPLKTTFEVLVDGTNGDTTLKPVKATLGSTRFTTSGAVFKDEGDTRKTIDLDVDMPRGNLRDLLQLAMKGAPFMEGTVALKTKIGIPPLTGKVKEKLLLDGTFDVTRGKFLKSTIQDQIDKLSRRGQGQPTNQEIDEVVSRMSGEFHMEDEAITFRTLAFAIPGATVNIAGTYDLGLDNLEFHGALSLDAKVSQTQSGWKRWVLKPADPFFSKNGAGTYLKIKIEGPSKKPAFGLDR